MTTGASAVTSGTGKDDWATPQWLFDHVNEMLGPFDLDAAASAGNTKCGTYCTVERSGLVIPWFRRVWLNPPYGKGEIERWAEKAYGETAAGRCSRVVMLLPAKTETRWFHELVWPRASFVIFIKRRVRFVDGTGKSSGSPTFGSMLAVFDADEVALSPTMPTVLVLDIAER